MTHRSGGCSHIQTHADHEPVDSHTCHCSVCKGVTGQDTTHVVFFRHADVVVDSEAGLKRQPFNAKNPDVPLALCTCGQCGTPIMPDDRQSRIRMIVPNLMGYGDQIAPASHHAFYDPASGVPRPNDRRPVYEALRPDFTRAE